MEDSKIRNIVRRLCNFHRQGTKPNIFIFSTPRSGSTWLMELILTQPGMKPCNEPFNLRWKNVVRALGIADWNTLYSDAALPDIERYIGSFLKNKSQVAFTNLLPWQQYHRPFTNRIVFKILHAAEDRIDWFIRTFDAQIVYLIRHPIPVALSREELPRLSTFLDSEFNRHFDYRQLTYARQISDSGSFLQKAVVDWCFQNAIPIKRHLKEVIFLTYEQLVIDPAPLIKLLATNLQLPDVSRISERLAEPSGSVSKSNKETADALALKTNRDKTWLVEKWRKRVDVDEEKKLMEILDVFDIDVYETGRFVPTDKYWVTQ